MIKGLKDIKPIVQIPDNSLLIMIVTLFVLIMMGVLLYLLLKPKKRRKKPSKKELVLQRLKSLDFDDDKEVAYSFTKDVYLFVDEKNKQDYDDIVQKLEPFKYKKDVPAMDKKLKKQIKEFIRSLS